MATRMQQRRGTASQWTSTNAGAGPVLNAGEIGWESDTNRFKIGDGVNNWSNLDYFADINSTINPSFGTSITFEGATANDFETTLQVTDPTADRTITIPDVTGTVITTGNLSDITNIGVFTSTIVMEGSTANDHELTLSAGDPTADRTIAFPDASGTVQLRVADIDDVEIGYLNGVTSAIQTQLNDKAPLASPTFTGTVTLPANTITQSMMSDDSVGTNEIGGSAVTTAKIADANVTEGKLADSAVTSAKIADGTIVNGDINASAAIDQSKISGLTTDLSNKLALAGGTMTGAIAMGTSKITGLGTPTDAADAVTKSYVDAFAEGLHIHASVVAATTTNITLATDVENGDVLDGVTLATGNRILVKNQSTASQNGIYVVAATGAPSRAADFDSPAEIDGGDFVFVTGGTANDNKGFVQINTVGTVGTDAIEFSQFSGAGTFTAGNGLTLTGPEFTINTGITADLSTVQTLTNKTLTSPIVTGLTLNDSSIVFEGATANDFETTLTVTDPTADRTITFPNLTGTVSLLDATETLSNKTLSSATLTGTLTAGGGVGTAGQILKSTGSGVEWGSAASSGPSIEEIVMDVY
jgi:hypothetical protein